MSSRFNQLGWLAAQHSSVTAEHDSLRYDASGNITWRKQGIYQPKTFTMESGHNRLIQIVQAGSPTRSIVYDDAGSRLTEVDSAVYFIDRQYFYDALGRTNGIFNIFDDAYGTNQPAGGIGMCWHDAMGRQIKACADGSPPLAFDGDNIIRALNWRFRHGPGLDDPLIALSTVGVAGPRELYYVTDGAGRHYAVGEGSGGLHTAILAGSDGYSGFRASGAVTNSHSYGEARLSQPNAPGLSFFRNRVYDQETGRWTQEDPIGIAGGINLYQFNGNDPASYDDPYGLCQPWPWCLLAAAAAGGGSAAIPELAATATAGSVGAAAAPVAVLAGLALWASLPVEPYPAFQVPGAIVQSDATAVARPFTRTRAGDLPASGPPNSSAAKDDGKGKGQIRDYDAAGRAKTDYDFGHDHGKGDPHAHDWDWSKSPPRQPARPLGADD